MSCYMCGSRDCLGEPHDFYMGHEIKYYLVLCIVYVKVEVPERRESVGFQYYDGQQLCKFLQKADRVPS